MAVLALPRARPRVIQAPTVTLGLAAVVAAAMLLPPAYLVVRVVGEGSGAWAIVAGVSVDAVDNLVWDYIAGDFFRSEDYWPSIVSDDDEFPATENEHGTFGFKHKFRETK